MFNWAERFISTEVTSYKIHILVNLSLSVRKYLVNFESRTIFWIKNAIRRFLFQKRPQGILDGRKVVFID